MIELHPAIVHFPIALIAIAALFAVLSLFFKKEFFKVAAFWNLLLGVAFAIAAVLTGFIEEQTLVHNDEIHQTLVKHKFTGFGILIFSFILLTWGWVRKNRFRKGEYAAWAFLLVLGTAAVFYQGYLGGKMVFEQGAGVKPMEQYMEHESDSTKPHSHSYSEQAHGSDDDSTSPDKTKPKRDQSSTPHEHTNKKDTSKKQDSIQSKDKKKELKDMKY
ncbi:MAG: DUF2231 domain-containing protein [Chitinophagaceae bacterium]